MKGHPAPTGARRQLADEIKRRRLQRSWSQLQLADIAGISPRTVQRLERSGNCTHETLLAIAEAFEIDVSELAGILMTGTPGRDSARLSWKEIHRMSFLKGLRGERVWIITGAIYLILLMGIVAYLSFTYGRLYEVFPSPRDEMLLNSSQSYQKVLQFSGVSLALFLGIEAALYGVWKGKLLNGLLALGAGVFLTETGYAFLPWVLYKHDQYSPAFLWLLSSLPIVVTCWLVVTILVRAILRPRVSA